MHSSFHLKYLVFLMGSLVFAMLMNSLFLRFVKTLGIRNTNEMVIRWSNESKPALGGITFYIIFLLSGAVYPVFFGSPAIVFSLKSLGILGATSLGFLMGLADDAYNTRPILKSITQLACALILVYTGTQIDILGNDILNKLLTVIWVIGIMNSLNMLDNMDGITGVVSFFVCLSIVALSITKGITPDLNLILVSGVMTSIIAFLYFNWHPAKMYMGDSGSQFLGIILSTMGIIYFWNPISGVNETFSLSKHFILPILAFLIPIVDTTTVTINRLGKGNSPFVGGKDHTTHFLAKYGLGDEKVAFVIALISLVSTAFVFLISTFNDKWNYFHAAFYFTYAVAVFTVLFYFTRQKS